MSHCYAFASCPYAEFHYDNYRHAECLYFIAMMFCHVKCRYAKCRHAERHSVHQIYQKRKFFAYRKKNHKTFFYCVVYAFTGQYRKVVRINVRQNMAKCQVAYL